MTIKPRARTGGPAHPTGRRRLSAWTALTRHAAQLRTSTLRRLFDDDPDRAHHLTIEASGLYADFSKNLVTGETVRLLVHLAQQCRLTEQINAMFTGERINTSERRPALHVALRAPSAATITVDGHNVVPEVDAMLYRMAVFARQVRDGRWTGYTGERIRTVVNIGIGGSDLGPRMAYHALAAYRDPAISVRFVANIDGADLTDAIGDLDPAKTLFVVCSKTWHTTETIVNAKTARDWILKAFGDDPAAVAKHFAAVSANTDEVATFGIPAENTFAFWDWVGGRYSSCSAVGLPLMIAIGPDQFRDMLAGSHDVDEHFRDTPFGRNIPVLMGLIAVWYNDFLGAATQVVLPYSHALAYLPAYLQQLEMESNGKRVTTAGRHVDYPTAPILWGQPGTNGQHAFYQLLHQGTRLVPADLIGVVEPLSPFAHQHDLLVANLFAQAEALAFGRSADQLCEAGVPGWQIPYRVCPGNRPSTTLLLDRLSPRSLGSLIALYEHKVFTEGVIFDVDSFDQWGVELGKILAGTIADELTTDTVPELHHDSSTTALIRHYRRLRDCEPQTGHDPIGGTS